MRAHLESGCTDCSTELSSWTRFRHIASRESRNQPPEKTVRIVKAFGAHRESAAKATLPKILFDSMRTPAFAGVRSSASPARVILYGIGDYRIDLRMEPRPGSKVSIVGQILVSRDSAHPAAAVPLAIMSGGNTVCTLETNDFGEFSCECQAEANLRLQLTLPDATDIKIPLLEPAFSSLKGSAQSTDSKSVSSSHQSKRKRTGKKDSPTGD